MLRRFSAALSCQSAWYLLWVPLSLWSAGLIEKLNRTWLRLTWLVTLQAKTDACGTQVHYAHVFHMWSTHRTKVSIIFMAPLLLGQVQSPKKRCQRGDWHLCSSLIPVAGHMHVTHLVFRCLGLCPQCQPWPTCSVRKMETKTTKHVLWRAREIHVD
jgi:hypothetical protein